MAVERPLEPLSTVAVVSWDAVIVDPTPLGRAALDTMPLLPVRPVIGLGMEAAEVTRVRLPLRDSELASALESVLYAEETSSVELHLDPIRSLVHANGGQAHLTRTEFRLLQLLYDAHPADVPLAEVLVAVWGSTEGEATSELVRTHLRNLRRKLDALGLTDVVRSRRGRGYSLHL